MIDYYNEMPESVKIIDKLNDEYIELLEKYNELQAKFNKLNTICINNIIFDNEIEKNIKHNEMLNNINKIIYDWVELWSRHKLFYDNGFEMIYTIDTPDICGSIEKEINKIILNKDLSKNMSKDCFKNILGLKGTSMRHWNKIYFNLEKEDIYDILSSNVKNYLFNNLYLKYKIKE